jgi:N-acetylglucosamine kinase-like BadF-type ATPase
MARDGIAGLAKVVSEAAEAGDMTARLILEDAGQELAVMARSLRDILEFTPDEATPLSWSGGVLTGQKLVSDALECHLGEGFVLIEPRHPPGNGAALYARLLSGR